MMSFPLLENRKNPAEVWSKAGTGWRPVGLAQQEESRVAGGGPLFPARASPGQADLLRGVWHRVLGHRKAPFKDVFWQEAGAVTLQRLQPVAVIRCPWEPVYKGCGSQGQVVAGGPGWKRALWALGQ